MIITVENFEKNPRFYLEDAIKAKKAVNISSNDGDAVLISAELFALLREEYELEMSLQRGEDDIVNNRVSDIDDVFDRIHSYIDMV